MNRPMDQEDLHDYVVRSPLDNAQRRVGYHMSEIFDTIAQEFDGNKKINQRVLAIAKHKIEDAMLWLRHCKAMQESPE